jgi:ribose transport system substrate-binding protein
MKKLKFLISLRMEENPYQKQHAATAEQVAQRLGVDLQIQYAGNDAIMQSEQLLNAIQSSSKDSRPDGIICAPVGTTLLRVARCAAENGIAWALLNREADYIAELRSSHKVPIFAVTVDQAEIGRIQGHQINALLPEGGLVLYLVGPGGIGDQRLAAMESAKSHKVQVRTLTGDWSEHSGYKAVSRWLQLKTSHETPAALVAGQNDDMAMGARRAFEELTSREERARWTSLPYIGCDCCPGAGLDWLRNGLLSASIVNPPSGGLALEMMVRAIQTKWQPPERTIVDPISCPAVEKLAGTLAHTGAA